MSPEWRTRTKLVGAILLTLGVEALAYHESFNRVWNLVTGGKSIACISKSEPVDAIVVSGFDGGFGDQWKTGLDRAADDFDRGVAPRIIVFDQPGWQDLGQTASSYLSLRVPSSAVVVLAAEKNSAAKVARLAVEAPRLGLRSLRFKSLPYHANYEAAVACNSGFRASADSIEVRRENLVVAAVKAAELGLSAFVDPKGYASIGVAWLFR